MEAHLPRAILERYKQPYRAPDTAAFLVEGGRLVDYAEELLSPEKVGEFGYFDPKRVSLLAKKARRGGVVGTTDNQAFVGILATQLWHHHFVERYSTDFSAS